MTSTAKTVVRDAAIVYGLTFAAGLCMAAAGITLENNSSTAYLCNLLSGVLGFTLVGQEVSTVREVGRGTWSSGAWSRAASTRPSG